MEDDAFQKTEPQKECKKPLSIVPALFVRGVPINLMNLSFFVITMICCAMMLTMEMHASDMCNQLCIAEMQTDIFSYSPLTGCGCVANHQDMDVVLNWSD